MGDFANADRPADTAAEAASGSSRPESRRSQPWIDSESTSASKLPTPSLRGTEAGVERRVDGPHAAPSDADGGTCARDAARIVRAESGKPVGPPALPFDSGAAGQEEELLLQASQIAEHLRAEFAELDRREQSLNEQLVLLDQERRNVRLWAHQYEEEMLHREEKLRDQESHFAQKLSECEQLVSDLEEQEKDLLKIRDNLDGERAVLKELLEQELAADREELERTRAALDAQRRQLIEKTEQLEVEREKAVGDVRKAVDAERDAMRGELMAELEAARSEFAREKSDWLEHRDAELADIQKDRDRSQAMLAAVEAELEERRLQHLEQLAEQRREQQRLLDDELAKFEAELDRQNEEWTTRRDAELAELETKRAAVEAELAEARGNLESEFRRNTEELERDHERRRQQLEQELEKRLQQQCQEQMLELQQNAEQFQLDREQFEQQRRVFESRIQFQQDHLAKARDELETAQREFRFEQQRALVRIEEGHRAVRLRKQQLDHYRALLSERELSLAREEELLGELRQSFEHESNELNQRHCREYEEWRQEQEAQRAELRRERDLLAEYSQSLDSRKARLDQLRSELEETHRRTLEMRMSVEEVWAGVSQTLGDEGTKRRVDEAREAIAEHYRQTRETLDQQRLVTADEQAALKRQRDEWLSERQRLTDSLSDRERWLRAEEVSLTEQTESIQTRETAWREARNRWAHEKIEAERVIRDLLNQLHDRNTEPETAPPAQGSQAPTATIGAPNDGNSRAPAPPHWPNAPADADPAIRGRRDP